MYSYKLHFVLSLQSRVTKLLPLHPPQASGHPDKLDRLVYKVGVGSMSLGAPIERNHEKLLLITSKTEVPDLGDCKLYSLITRQNAPLLWPGVLQLHSIYGGTSNYHGITHPTSQCQLIKTVFLLLHCSAKFMIRDQVKSIESYLLNTTLDIRYQSSYSP